MENIYIYILHEIKQIYEQINIYLTEKSIEIIQNFKEKEDYQREDPDKLTCLMFMKFFFFWYLFNLIQKTEIREQIKRA